MKKVMELPKKIRPPHDLLLQKARNLGCVQVKMIMTKTIVLARWLRVQCQYGCPHYMTLLTCPPFTPTIEETSDLLLDYQKALLVQAADPRRVREIVVDLEESLKSNGNSKAFALCAAPCELCEVCTVETHCEHPEAARPTLRAFGIDVSKTIANNGWNLEATAGFCNEPLSVGMVLIE